MKKIGTAESANLLRSQVELARQADEDWLPGLYMLADALCEIFAARPQVPGEPPFCPDRFMEQCGF